MSSNGSPPAKTIARNVLGGELEPCSLDPMTGFYRDGCCETGPQDSGSHTVCATMTDAFLRYTASRGNDLSTPMPQYGFAGLKAGDRWCLCVSRWREAMEAGVAPPVVLAATNEAALRVATREELERHAAEAEADTD